MSGFPLFVPTHHHKSYPAIAPALSNAFVKGKVVVITGGGKGIGKANAVTFAKANAKAVIIFGRTEKTLKDTAQVLQAASSSQIKYYVADATDYTRISKIFQSIKEEFGALDIVVDNKGYASDSAPIKSAGVDEWYKAFDINIKGSFAITQAFVNNASPGATFISTNSGALSIYVPGFTSYGASKLALARLTEDAQVEHPEFRFFTYHPGVIESDMNRKSEFPPQDDEDLAADFCVWLVNPQADFLKGRMVWANWDVEELKSKSKEIVEKDLLKSGVRGYPPNDFIGTT